MIEGMTGEHRLIDDLLIVSIPVTITAIATVWTTIVARKTRKEGQTGNGRSLGETVHDISQLQEVQAALSHTNTKELLDVSQKFSALQEKLEDHIDESRAIHAKLMRMRYHTGTDEGDTPI